MKPTETATNYDAPADLSPSSRELWKSLVPSRARTPGRLAMICVALRALDRANEASVILSREGLTTTTATTGAVHVHPLAKLELEHRRQFLTAMKSLSLEWSADDSR